MALIQIIGVGISLVILFAVLYAFYSKNSRRRLLRKFEREGSLPKPFEHTLFFEGVATNHQKVKDLIGNTVAFHALHILKKSFSATRKFGLQSMNGFELVYNSGDFFVQSKINGKEYKIGVSDYQERLSGFAGAYAQTATKVLLTGENTQRQNVIAELETGNRATESMMAVIFNYFAGKAESRTKISVPLYQKSFSTIEKVKPKANIDFRVHEFVVGENLPPMIKQLIREKKAAEFVQAGDKLFVIELVIPLGKTLFVAGSYEPATNSIVFRNSKIGLSVSYENPAL